MEIFKSREIQNSILWSREKTPLATTPPPPHPPVDPSAYLKKNSAFHRTKKSLLTKILDPRKNLSEPDPRH